MTPALYAFMASLAAGAAAHMLSSRWAWMAYVFHISIGAAFAAFGYAFMEGVLK